MSNVLPFPGGKVLKRDGASSPPDHEERRKALNPERSFLVQAPAGSGKTHLLTQRFLRLLGQAEEPEEIVAITFTNAAAAEMRRRILEELEKAEESFAAADDTDLPSGNPENLPTLAVRALEQARRKGWNLLDQPGQLRITTIDAFCRGLALQCPLSWGVVSGLGGSLDPVSDPTNLYRRSAAQTMQRLLDGSAAHADAAAMRSLMLWRDNNWKDVEDLLVKMLGDRNRWYQDFLFDRDVDWVALRKRLEGAFCRAAKARLQRLAGLLDRTKNGLAEAMKLASFACGNGGKSVPQGLAELAEFPSWMITEALIAEAQTEEAALLEDAVAAHQELAEFLLIGKGKWRSSAGLNMHYGFPATDAGRAGKARFAELVADLEKIEGLEDALAGFQKPIPTRYSDEEWTLIQDCFAVLRAAAIELQLVFAETGSVDFVEVAQIALRVLAPEEGSPPEFAMNQSRNIRHLLVDEFQDTSRNQHLLLSRLIAAWPEREGRTCFCVGDPMQSIYGFREAEVELFERLKTHGLENSEAAYFATPWAAEPFLFEFVSLTANFRTVPSLVTDLNRRFGQIFAQDDGSGVRFTEAVAARLAESTAEAELHLAFTRSARPTNEDDEPNTGNADLTREKQLSEMVGLIRSRLAAAEANRNGIGDAAKFRIAVLGRTKKSLIVVAEALRQAGIGYRAIELVPLGERPEVLDALAMAQALLNPTDRLAWLGVLRAPWCGLSLEELHALTSADDATVLEIPIPILLETRLPDLLREGRISERAHGAAARVARTMRNAEAKRPAAGTAMLGTWLEAVWKSLGGEATVDAEQRENLRVLWGALDVLPGGELDLLGPELAVALGKLCAQPDPAASSDFGVQLMTIHKSKGLEFEVVLVPDLEMEGKRTDSSLVSWLERGLASSDSEELTEFLVAPVQAKGTESGPARAWVDRVKREREGQELRRLLYVAATRAREELHLFARPRYCVKQEKQGRTVTLEAAKGLLQTAWPAVRAEVEAAFAAWVDQVEAAERGSEEASLELAAGEDKIVEMPASSGFVLRPTRIRRLPAGYVPPPLQLPDRGRSAAGESPVDGNAANGGAQEALFARTEGGLQSRLEGSILHSLLEELARLRMKMDPAAANVALKAMLPREIAGMRSLGLAPDAAKKIAEKLLAVVQQAATHATGAWILSPHRHAGSEARWTGLLEGQARNLRPDRVFWADVPHFDGSASGGMADEAGLDSELGGWWIIDYKTTYAEADVLSSAEVRRAFVERQRSKYAEQLTVYASLLRMLLKEGGLDGGASEQSPVIRAGLFYPKMRFLDFWEA